MGLRLAEHHKIRDCCAHILTASWIQLLHAVGGTMFGADSAAILAGQGETDSVFTSCAQTQLRSKSKSKFNSIKRDFSKVLYYILGVYI